MIADLRTWIYAHPYWSTFIAVWLLICAQAFVHDRVWFKQLISFYYEMRAYPAGRGGVVIQLADRRRIRARNADEAVAILRADMERQIAAPLAARSLSLQEQADATVRAALAREAEEVRLKALTQAHTGHRTAWHRIMEDEDP